MWMIEESWFENLPVKIIGKRVICFKKATSTNDLAWLEVSRNAPEGTIIFAGAQSKGRGRFGRTWLAPPGAGICASVVTRPNLNIEKAPLVLVVGAIAVCELIRERFNLPATIRWPNDVMLGEKKIAGIIIETKCITRQPEAIVLGIGFNINLSEAEIPAELKGEITSLAIESGRPMELKEVSRHFVIYLDKWYQKITAGRFDEIALAWQGMSGLLGRSVILETEGQKIAGLVTDLDPVAGIKLQLPEGERQFRGEKITLLRLVDPRP